jgi:hypothetical protein
LASKENELNELRTVYQNTVDHLQQLQNQINTIEKEVITTEEPEVIDESHFFPRSNFSFTAFVCFLRVHLDE